MCGIAGILSLSGPSPQADELQRMAGALHHRGPDEFGAYRDNDCGLAHARLSIIDLATGQQPLSNEDDSLFLVFNGEIFNYVELREELTARGHQFKTKSDTEVIVHAWEEWQHQAFERFNGQWAIALWDRKRKTLLLSRDRVGVRPLYFARHQGRLLFASEVKAIFAADPTIPRRLDPHGIDETLTFWSVVPPQTVFEGIEELEPGYSLVVDSRGLQRHRHYHPEFPRRGAEAALSVEDSTRLVAQALENATRLRMVRADVPVGSYLSGGLDSSLVAAMGLRAKGSGFATFSLRFEDTEYDETAFQRAMVEMLGSHHHEVVCKKSDIAAVFPEVIYHTERPLLRTAPAPMFLLSKLVRSHGVKVVLTGEGADEMFAGYDLFREARLRRFCARQPTSKTRPRLLEKLYPYLERSPVAMRAIAQQFFLRDLHRAAEPGFSHDMRWQSTSALKRLYAASFRSSVAGFDARARLLASLPPDYAQWSTLAQDQYLEIRTLLSGYILSSQGDRMLMANSVEGRFPFLDREVMQLAASLPASHKLNVLNEKYVLKRVANDWIPRSIINRPKQPYRAPDASAFLGNAIPEYVEEALSERQVAEVGVFDPSQVKQLWGKCKARQGAGQFSNTDNMALVGVLSTQLLHQQLVQAPRPVPVITFQTFIER